jgi:hypothetical protein
VKFFIDEYFSYFSCLSIVGQLRMCELVLKDAAKVRRKTRIIQEDVLKKENISLSCLSDRKNILLVDAFFCQIVWQSRWNAVPLPI